MKLKLILVAITIIGIFLSGCIDEQNSIPQIIKSEDYNISNNETTIINNQQSLNINTTQQTTTRHTTTEQNKPMDTQQDNLIYNKNIVVYPFEFSTLKFEEFTGDLYCSVGDMYRIEIECESPINLVVIKDQESFRAIESSDSWPKWSFNDRTWQYLPGTQTIVKEDSIIKKTVEFTIPENKEYKIYLDGRVALSDALQDGISGDNPFKVNIKIYKISKCSNQSEFLIDETVGIYDYIPRFMLDEGTYKSGWTKIYDFKQDLNLSTLQQGDEFSLKITSEEPINCIVCNYNEIYSVKTNIPTWNAQKKKWHYIDGLYPLIFKSEVYDVDETFIIDTDEQYYLIIDGRIAKLVDSAWAVDIKLKQIK